ncbi:MAG: VOC family protein [Pseudomonadota bacterium]
MELGAFSVSLSVSNLSNSRSFYEALGFQQVAGEAEQGWLILRNGACTLGLFQGMFEKNMLTFNPGWVSETEPMESFTDIRAIQARLKEAGLSLVTEADPNSTGPASLVVEDPDGNPVLIDQHVPAP